MPALGMLGGVSARALGFASSAGGGGTIATSLFNFSTHTFTSGGVVGRFGPTITTLRNSYASQAWAQNAQYFFQGRAQGYQVFQIPVDGIYEIEAAGARGQDGTGGSLEHGRGAIVRARFTLSSSQKLEMVVGQVPGSGGQNPNAGGASGGGGGSFVAFYQTNTPLIVAGGGGGRYSTGTTQSVRNGQTRRQPRHTGYSYSPNTDGVQPALGEGGSGYHAGGGGGFLTSGQPYIGRTLADSTAQGGGDNVPPLYTQGSSFCGGGQLSGFYAIGGNWSGYNYVEGGFGGGGGGHSGNNTGGGGGGYSGGHGGQTSIGGSHNDGIGGGSYIDPSGTNVATSDGLYDGSSTFGGGSITNIGSFNDATGYIKITLVSVAGGGGGGGGGSSSLYTFSGFTFTNAGVTGVNGPTLANCLSSYDTIANPWLNNISYFNVSTPGLQLWTVPATRSYQFTVVGAHGAMGTSGTTGTRGGRGAIVNATLTLNAGDVIRVIVGQAGSYDTNNGGGGGASVVYNVTAATLLFIAGGGGGTRQAASVNGTDASTAQYGLTPSSSSANDSNVFNNTTYTYNGRTATLGYGGVEGNPSGYGDSGSGWLGNGADDNASTSTVAQSLSTTAVGGGSGQGGAGGFGGGGSGSGSNGGGGGGGYTGGNGGWIAGGGGSYFIPSAAGASVSIDTTRSYNLNGSPVHGYVTITPL